MRLVFSLVVIVMAVALLGFALTNMETHVPITFIATEHPNVSLIGVVFLAVLFGMTCVAIVALVEGAAIRLANRRLQREVERLDAELNYLRTQRAAAPRPEPDALTESDPGIREPVGAVEEHAPASRPVYDAESWDRDPDDDAYSGGRAV